MRSLLDPSEREALLGRFRKLNSGTRPAWGQLTAPRMVCHLSDQLRVALGDLPSKDQSNLFTRSLLRLLVVYTSFEPPPGKVQTAPEMLTTQPTSWEEDCGLFESLVQRLAGSGRLAPHPTFGPLSPNEWGRLSWKHINHHLRQFGV
jgi:hypothetical protein